MLKLLFPAAVEEITSRRPTTATRRCWSGRAAPSDIAAGLALGAAVAAVFTARAATDGMRNAIGTRAQWDAFAAHAAGPRRDPVDQPRLAAAAAHAAVLRTGARLVHDAGGHRGRAPGAAAVHLSAQMKQELAEVKSYSDGATREQVAIAHKWSDGAGTYTPPGHWNDIAAEHIRDARMSEVRAARAFALLNMSLQDAAVGCWEAKYFYFNPRPTHARCRASKTAIGVPNFPAYTSGHSTFSGAAAARPHLPLPRPAARTSRP